MVWRTILAYGIVLWLGQLTTGAGLLFAVPFLKILFIFHPLTRIQIVGFLTGCIGSLATIFFAYFVFRWIIGEGSFTSFPFIAATVPILVFLRKYAQIFVSNKAHYEQTQNMDSGLEGIRVRGICVGLIIGAVVGLYLFLNGYFEK